MSFASLTFWLFFIIVLTCYWLVREKHRQNILLLLASYVFYGWVNPWLAFMLGTSTLIDFFLARGMRAKTLPGEARTRSLLTASLIINLGVLAFFKYYDFFSTDLTRFVNQLGLQADFLLTRVLLPAGLSFYTLKKLAYVIDVSRGTLQPTSSLIDFALYVSFFPQLVAGPIDRPQKLLVQMEAPRVWSANYFYEAWPLLIMGLFKKIVVADSVKVIVGEIFMLQQPSIFLLIMGTLAFSLQILADFSGYTDLSRGLARLLGFETSQNFNLPYASLTPTDFWNRWHITLSTWLRDYVFFPLGRALRKSQIRLPQWLLYSIPPIVTMFISGLWHGAGLTFIVWGLYYGVLIAAYQLVGLGGNWRPTSIVQRAAAWVVMFFFINLGWALFRAPSLAWLGNILMHSSFIQSRNDLIVGAIALSMVLVYATPLFLKLALQKFSNPDGWLLPAYYAFATILIIIFIDPFPSDFIYFQF